MTTSAGHNIRYFAEVFIGKKLVDVSQNDEPCDDENGRYVELFFENGTIWRFYTKDGSESASFAMSHPEDCKCKSCEEMADANEDDD